RQALCRSRSGHDGPGVPPCPVDLSNRAQPLSVCGLSHRDRSAAASRSLGSLGRGTSTSTTRTPENQEERDPMTTSLTTTSSEHLSTEAGLGRRTLTVPHLVFLIIAASAPLTVVAGGAPTSFAVTGL